MKSVVSVFILFAQALLFAPAGAADTLARIKQTQELRLGYFTASPPFSFTGTDKNPQGYSVDLCARIATGIQRQLGVTVKPVWVAIDINQRVQAVRDGRIDIECGTTTWTFGRQQAVDFSLMTFVDGASLLVPADSGIRQIADVDGKRVAVIKGTTTDKALADALAKGKKKANILYVGNHEQGAASVAEGKSDAYASDRFLLKGQLARPRPGQALRLIDEDFSIEPYALVLPRNDHDFRLAVNRSLGEMFRSGEMARIYDRWLSQFGQRSLLLSALYYLQAVPE